MSIATDVQRINTSLDAVTSGKAAIAAAITEKGVETAEDATFDVLAANIGDISGGGPAVEGGKTVTFYVDSDLYSVTSIKADKAITEPQAPTIESGAFLAWNDSAGNPVAFPFDPPGDASLHASYIAFPAGYTPCKYLSGTGTQYIVYSQITLDMLSGVKCRASNPGHDSAILGDGGWASAQLLVFAVNGSLMFWKGKSLASKGIPSGDYFDVSWTDEAITLDGTVVLANTPFGKVANPLYIMGSNGNNSKGRIYSLELIGTGGNTISYLLPCLDDHGVPCLYDVIARRTLYNSGTGSFGYEV